MVSPSLPLRGLYVITDERLGGGHLALARSALEGGARIIQLRDKSTPPPLLLPIARELRRMTRAMAKSRRPMLAAAAAGADHRGH